MDPLHQGQTRPIPTGPLAYTRLPCQFRNTMPYRDHSMSSSVTKTNVITVYPSPSAPQLVAKFTASPLNGTAPLRVQFTDQSTGSPVAFNYDFGDGFHATSKNPVHTYRFPGVYNVTLTILKHDMSTGSVISNVSIQKNLIVVT